MQLLDSELGVFEGAHVIPSSQQLATAAATRPGFCRCNATLTQLLQLRAIFQQLRSRKPGIPQLLQREVLVQLVEAAAFELDQVPAAQTVETPPVQ